MHPTSGKHWNGATDCAASCFGSIVTFRKRAPSTDPVVAKLQQDPQIAWSFTGVTAPERASRSGLDVLQDRVLDKEFRADTYRTASSRRTQGLSPLYKVWMETGGLCLASCLVCVPSLLPAPTWCDPTWSSGPERRTNQLCS